MKFKFKTGLFSSGFEINDRVEILGKPNAIASLRHRKNWNGHITGIDGGYILVRPMWRDWEVELYACEIKKI